MRKKARGGSWQGREGSEGSSWGERGPAAPLPSGERSWRSRAGKEPERGGRPGGTEGEGIAEPWARDFFGPFRPTKESGKTPATVFIVPRPGERIARCGKCDAAGRGTGDRGLCPFCGRIGVREVELSPPACRSLAGPGPFQSREDSCRDNPRPSLPSFLPKTLRLGSPHPGDRPRSSHSLPEEKRGSWSSGGGPEGARRGRKKRRVRQSFLFSRPHSLLSLQAPPRESCFFPAVSAVILSKNPVQ